MMATEPSMEVDPMCLEYKEGGCEGGQVTGGGPFRHFEGLGMLSTYVNDFIPINNLL